MKIILCFGDSLTWGYNPESNKRYKYEDRWTSILQTELNNDEKNNYIVISEGLCGRTTVFNDPFLPNRESFVPLQLSLESHDPDVVVLMLGTNDLKSYVNGNPKEIALGCLNLIQIIKKYKSTIKIYLIVPPKIGKTNHDMELFFFDKKDCSLSDNYKQIGKLSCTEVIDVNEFMIPNEIDGIHFGIKENKILAEVIGKKIINKFSQ